MDWFDRCMIGVLVGVGLTGVVGLGVAGYESVQQTRLERACLAAGYPSADWRWFGPGYCIKRVDQTDVVVPYGG